MNDLVTQDVFEETHLCVQKGRTMKQFFEAFKHPPKEFSFFPFWFWNDHLSFEEIERSLKDFQSKGIDGVVIHPRIGLSKEIGYLTDQFFTFIEFAVEKAAELDMQIILYDEGMYPSGSAHGKIVDANPELASKGALLLKKNDLDAFPHEIIDVIGTYDIHLGTDGWEMTSGEEYVLIFAYTGGNIRGVHLGEDDFQQPPKSTDLLQKETAKKFLAYTHEQYYKRLADYFGNTIIGFFTDEPDMVGRNAFPNMLPWTQGIEEALDLAEIRKTDLPRLFLESKNSSDEQAKESYRTLIHQQLGTNYYAELSEWCRKHDIALMGHPHGSMDIGYQEYFDVPGQDMVWRWVEPGVRGGITGIDSTAAKCSADAARHLGRRRNSNEVFGCCGPDGNQWAFTLQDMKWYLNWLFVRGVNLIIPHAFFYSLKGVRGEDRPPDVGPNNLWWPYFKQVAYYSKRMSWLMTDAVNQTNIAVLCQSDQLPWEEVVPLWEQQIEFNYLEKKYLDQLRVDQDGFFSIENQRYTALIVSEELSFEMEEKVAILKQKGLKVFCHTKIEEIKEAAIHRPLLSEFVPEIRYSQVKKEGCLFHLFSNEGLETVEFDWSVKQKICEFNLDEGEIYAVNPTEGALAIRLYPSELKVFAERLDDTDYPVKEATSMTEVPFDYQLSTSPFDLTDFEGWEKFSPSYSGEVSYQLVLTIDQKENWGDFVLDLGEVKDLVVLDTEADERKMIFGSPYQLSIGQFASNNRKELKLIVINSLTNQYGNNPRPSGILGPVKLYRKHISL